MVNDSAGKYIGTETVNITCKDGMVHAPEAVWYVPDAWYNLIHRSARRRRMPDPNATRCHHNYLRRMIILRGEKCGGIYKLKEGNSVRGGVSGISLEESSSRGGASRKIATEREPD